MTRRSAFNGSSKSPLNPYDLIEAARTGDVKAVQSLLKRGADPDIQMSGIIPLVAAAKLGYADVVQVLLKHGTDPDQRNGTGDTALIWAAANNDTQIAHLLLDAGAGLEEEGNHECWTALLYATNKGHTKAVRLLIDKGADIDAVDNKGNTALDIAERENHPEVALILKDAAKARQQLIEDAIKAEADRIKRVTSSALQRDMPAPKVLKITPPNKK
jgi:ankyrin repeat protein